MTQCSDTKKKRLHDILTCLMNYKKTITSNTLNSQNPNYINTVTTTLRRQSSILTNFMKFGNMPNNPDTELSECIKCLSPLLTPWDMDLSVLCPQLCNAIFIDSEFNQSDNLINTMVEQYCPSIDGLSSDP